MKCGNLIMLLSIGALSLNTFAVVIDDFEDGDYTNSPTWEIYSDTGQDRVVADPHRSNNLVYKAQGTSTGDRILYNFFDDTLPWQGFDLSYEFMASNMDYHFQIGVRGDTADVGLTSDLHYRSTWSQANFKLGQLGSDEVLALNPSDIPVNAWLKMHFWHDLSTDIMHQQITLLETGQLIASISTPAVDDYSQGNINRMYISIERADWQYIDNINLVPEPCTLLLLGSGGLALRLKRN